MNFVTEPFEAITQLVNIYKLECESSDCDEVNKPVLQIGARGIDGQPTNMCRRHEIGVAFWVKFLYPMTRHPAQILRHRPWVRSHRMKRDPRRRVPDLTVVRRFMFHLRRGFEQLDPLDLFAE